MTAGGATHHLAALGAHLSARGYKVELTERGLRAGKSNAEETISLRRRPEDSDRPWFWTAAGEPVAPADRIIDAGVFLMGHLAERHDRPEGAER
ncbi:hypothetical protein GCM10023085_72780 [Actinomadura viridis]|uniref:Uncharacterized protein n=1 Tax=Actinomadura viridis TaxID=58110 RepID=A0A931DUJ7_9ACTN|nr:hypothetical protein [Actinomadura viridis]MBG6092963.1 hypothetical protein [Actinomadura viridis]